MKRIERLYCRNERAVIQARLLPGRETVALVAVGAILVASIHLKFIDDPLTLDYEGPSHIPCSATFRRGDEMGHFQHGSTIIVLTSDRCDLHPNIREGQRIRMGEPLLRRSFLETGPE